MPTGAGGTPAERLGAVSANDVLAPQAENAWMADGPGYAPRLKALIDSLVTEVVVHDREHTAYWPSPSSS